MTEYSAEHMKIRTVILAVAIFWALLIYWVIGLVVENKDAASQAALIDTLRQTLEVQRRTIQTQHKAMELQAQTIETMKSNPREKPSEFSDSGT